MTAHSFTLPFAVDPAASESRQGEGFPSRAYCLGLDSPQALVELRRNSLKDLRATHHLQGNYAVNAASEDVASSFAFVRVVATSPIRSRHQSPRQEWLIIEWPRGDETPSD